MQAEFISQPYRAPLYLWDVLCKPHGVYKAKTYTIFTKEKEKESRHTTVGNINSPGKAAWEGKKEWGDENTVREKLRWH